jgi:hypothetical protein
VKEHPEVLEAQIAALRARMYVNEAGYHAVGPSWLRLGFTVAESLSTRRLWVGLSVWRFVVSGSIGMTKKEHR